MEAIEQELMGKRGQTAEATAQLEALNAEKKYKPETLYLAASLCDRYLVNLAIKQVKAPSLIILSVVCTLMAAKLE